MFATILVVLFLIWLAWFGIGILRRCNPVDRRLDQLTNRK
jgi:hypothetical protein